MWKEKWRGVVRKGGGGCRRVGWERCWPRALLVLCGSLYSMLCSGLPTRQRASIGVAGQAQKPHSTRIQWRLNHLPAQTWTFADPSRRLPAPRQARPGRRTKATSKGRCLVSVRQGVFNWGRANSQCWKGSRCCSYGQEECRGKEHDSEGAGYCCQCKASGCECACEAASRGWGSALL